MTWLIAFLGIVVLVWGLVLFVGFGIALKVVEKIRATSAYGKVADSAIVRTGEKAVNATVDAIPNRFVRRLIRMVVPEGGDLAGNFVVQGLADKRSTGGLVALLGGGIFVASFFLGPWLDSLIRRA
jgi:hypothetical protein